MQFATPFLLTVLSLAGLGASQVADGFDGLVPREAGPLASAYAETLAEAHPHDVEEIQGIYARAAAGAKKQVCKRELSPRCFGSRDGHLVCNPPNGRITLPPAVQHGNPIPIDCLRKFLLLAVPEHLYL